MRLIWGRLAKIGLQLQHLEQSIADAIATNTTIQTKVDQARDDLDAATRAIPAAPLAPSILQSSRSPRPAQMSLTQMIDRTNYLRSHINSLQSTRDAFEDLITHNLALRDALEADQAKHAVAVAAVKAEPPPTSKELQELREQLRLVKWKAVKLESTERQGWGAAGEINVARTRVASETIRVGEVERKIDQVRAQIEKDGHKLDKIRVELDDGVLPTAER